ncbi:9596_t:CDS:10, partial [Acaulospora morrowiae]
ESFTKSPTSGKVSPAIENSTHPPTVSSPTPDSSKINGNSNAAASSANVKVTIRVRPPNAVELSRGENEIWEVNNDAQNHDNKALFEKGVRDTVGAVMEGYNGTVFAYGQTSSGKTFTMVRCNYNHPTYTKKLIPIFKSDIHDNLYSTKSNPGVIPQAVDTVFEYIKKCQEKQFLLRVSYMEIYNETVRDLLSPDTVDLRIHEDKHRGVYVSPLKEVLVSTPDQVMEEISKGEANRHTGATDWNERSSRSHSIFQMTVESAAKGSLPFRQNRYSMPGMPKMSGSVYSSVLNLIDLAGSEKATTSIDRRKEGSYINKSLLTLATVISKLTEKNSGHIPFRDSKLTRILQNSLSGNARVAVICTISPSIINLEESSNTLKFASRVKKVVTKAQTNEVLDDKALIQKYRMEIEELKVKLERTNSSNEQELSKKLEIEMAKHEEEMLEAQLIRTALKERIDHLTKLILTNTSFNGAPSPAQSKRQMGFNGSFEPANGFTEIEAKLDEKDMKINQLLLELKKKDELVEQLTAQLSAVIFNNTKQNENELISKLQEQNEELQALRDANKRLSVTVEQQKKKLQTLENN